MKYLEATSNMTFSEHSLRIHYKPSDNTMMIDMSVFQSLEIMRSLQSSSSKSSLFGLLNATLTPMGARMLRSCILQPPTQTDTFITPRHDALEELVSNEEMFFATRKALKSFSDAERTLTKVKKHGIEAGGTRKLTLSSRSSLCQTKPTLPMQKKR